MIRLANRPRWACTAAVCAAQLSAASSASAEQRYSMVRIAELGDGGARPIAMNSRSQVVGSSWTFSHEYHAFLWSVEDGITDLTPDWPDDSIAYDVNESGRVVGEVIEDLHPTDVLSAFVWANGQWEDLNLRIPPDSGWTLTTARGINNAGQIVGWGKYQRATHGYLLTPGDPYYDIVDLGTLGGTQTCAYAVNNHGVVAGFSTKGNGQRHAFLWREGVMQDLGTLGGDASEAQGINDLEQVVGFARSGWNQSYGHAFLWQDGVMTDLGTLGGAESYAWRINESGTVLGGAEGVIAWEGESAIWTDGLIQPLDSLLPRGAGLKLYFEEPALNDAGRIAMSASDGHGWMLVPLDGSILRVEVNVLGGSTIEARMVTTLPEGATFSVSLESGEFQLVSVRPDGRAVARFFNQTGPHTVCMDGQADGCAFVECDPIPSGYVIQELPPLPHGARSGCGAVGDTGIVVGEADGIFGSHVYHAVSWEQGQTIDLGTLGGQTSNASDLNAMGWIVGTAQSAEETYHAVLWVNGRISDLGNLGGSNAFAEGVNDAGQIVGQSGTSEGNVAAFFWEVGVMTPIPVPGNPGYSTAQAINSAGEVVGYWDSGDQSDRPFRWSPGGDVSEMQRTGLSAYPYAINDHGVAAGAAVERDFGNRAVVWAPDGTIHVLVPEDSYNSSARGINNAGEIVGVIRDELTGQHAVRWDANGRSNLNKHLHNGCPWDRLSFASSINERGQIGGYGSLAGEDRGFLMTPAYAGNIQRLSASCKRGDLVVRVKSWLPPSTTLTASTDTGHADCMTTDASGRAKTRLYGAAGAANVCLLEYDRLCRTVSCR
ncbi:MAG: hypothetical protein IT449_09695 [Phycisphaerales bacterium]|nr:hypothetical protein [Phycisphaerales bacterium]